MNFLYICEDHPPLAATGQTLRRNGICKGLTESGYSVDILTSGRSSEDVDNLREALNNFHNSPDLICIIEGFEFALAIRRRLNLENYLVDICDSRRLIASLDPKMRNAFLFSKFRKHIKVIRNGIRLRLLSRACKGFIYISNRDLMADDPFIRKNLERFILPNGVDQNVADSIGFSANGDFLVVGNWNYVPNIEMLSLSIGLLESDQIRGDKTLRITGPNLDTSSLPAYPWIRYTGWVEKKSDIYTNAFCLLAPIVQGGGIKNKVLEAISYGIPVFGLKEAFESIPDELKTSCFPLGDVSEFRQKVARNPHAVLIGLQNSSSNAKKYSWARSVQSCFPGVSS